MGLQTKIYTASEVAKYLLVLDSSKGAEGGISNLKLQKLLYYVQGFHLALTGRPCFADPIKAWEHGPVVESVYRQYNGNGKRSLPVPKGFVPSFDEETKSVIDEVHDVYGQYSAWRLRDMTHEEAPWRDTPRNGTISLESMRHFCLAYVKET